MIFIFLLYSVLNHSLLVLVHKFHQRRPSGKRMVKISLSCLLTDCCLLHTGDYRPALSLPRLRPPRLPGQHSRHTTQETIKNNKILRPCPCICRLYHSAKSIFSRLNFGPLPFNVCVLVIHGGLCTAFLTVGALNISSAVQFSIILNLRQWIILVDAFQDFTKCACNVHVHYKLRIAQLNT